MGKEIPKKLFYKIGEVCEATDTQPYVLRFWESEFPQLAPQKNRAGQRIYRSQDIETVERIKRLLYEEGYTIAGARKRLDQEETRPVDAPPGSQEPQTARDRKPSEAPGSPRRAAGLVLRELRALLERMDETDRKLGRR